MYGKHFASMYTGSMYGAGPVVFAVWGYVIAHAMDSTVELNPRALADTLGTSHQSICEAVTYLCSPDPESRNKEAEGRRLIQEGEFSYHVPSHATYRAVRNEQERREYNRQKKAEQRAREKAVNSRVNDSQRMSAHTEAEAVSRNRRKSELSVRGGAGGEEAPRARQGARRLPGTPEKLNAILASLSESADG